MSNKTREQLKQIFVIGAKPSQTNFQDWLDNYVHITDNIPNTIANQITAPQTGNLWLNGTARFGNGHYNGILIKKGDEGSPFPTGWYHSITPNTLAIGLNNGGGSWGSSDAPYTAAVSVVENRHSTTDPQSYYANNLSIYPVGLRNSYLKIGIESIMNGGLYEPYVAGSFSAAWYTGNTVANNGLILVGAENIAKTSFPIINAFTGSIFGSRNTVELEGLDVFIGIIAAGYFKAVNSGISPVHNIYSEGTAKNFFESGITTGAPSSNGAANMKFGKVLAGSSTTITTDKFMEVESDGVHWKVPVIPA